MNNYKVTMTHDDFYRISSSIKAKEVAVEAKMITFFTNKKGLALLKESGLEYEIIDSSFEQTKKELNLAFPFIFGLILLIGILYLNTYRINQISFNIATPINSKIKADLMSKTKRLFWFDFIAIDYEQYGQNLRIKHPNYPWINVHKDGSNIVVDIFEYDTHIDKDMIDPYGNIIANKDGIIKEFYIYDGASDLSINKYVKKGDILVHSNILAFSNQENAIYTSAKGLILANTYEEITITVPKKLNTEKKSGKTNEYYQIGLFGSEHKLFNKESYLNKTTSSHKKFSLFGFLTVNKILEEEQLNYESLYSYEEAKEYSETMIENNFTLNKTFNLETIDDLVIINEIEDDIAYTFTYLVKKTESIGAFEPLSEKTS